jgi:hypothetical protein
MDVVSHKNVHRLAATQGKVRIYEMDDGSWIQASDGTVAWRNNNPGNLKFEFSGSADRTTRSKRTREDALSDAQALYGGIVDLDQWGNAIFESYEAGREAQQKLLQSRMAGETVEELVKSYSVSDYSGVTHHRSQVATIHATALSQGQDLHRKAVRDMTADELNALCDGLSKAEGWKAGTVEAIPAQTPEQLSERLQRMARQPEGTISANRPAPLRQGSHGAAVSHLQEQLAGLGYTRTDGRPLPADGHLAGQTKAAIESFQRAHRLPVDGIAGERTLGALAAAQQQVSDARQAHAPLLDSPTHPAHELFEQAREGVWQLDAQHGRTPGAHSDNLAASLTSEAVRSGMKRIDHVAINDDASRAFAVQGEVTSPFKRYVEVDLMQAIQTPLSRSSSAALQAIENVEWPQEAQRQSIQQSMTQEQSSARHMGP